MQFLRFCVINGWSGRSCIYLKGFSRAALPCTSTRSCSDSVYHPVTAPRSAKSSKYLCQNAFSQRNVYKGQRTLRIRISKRSISLQWTSPKLKFKFNLNNRVRIQHSSLRSLIRKNSIRELKDNRIIVAVFVRTWLLDAQRRIFLANFENPESTTRNFERASKILRVNNFAG